MSSFLASKISFAYFSTASLPGGSGGGGGGTSAGLALTTGSTASALGT